MPLEFKLPDLGEGIHEGEIIDVLVAVGDRVLDGQTVLVVETDKAATEVPAPVTGTVKEIRVKPGETVKVGMVLMVFEADGRATAPVKPEKADASPPAPQPVATPEPVAAPAKPEKSAVPASSEGPVPAAPSTRRLARELGVDLHQIPPSGPGGRVTSEDVQAFAQKGTAVSAPAVPPTSTPAPVPTAPEPPVSAPAQAPEPLRAPAPSPLLPDFSRWGTIERIPLRSVRKATAEHMALAWSQIPHVTHQDVADITELDAFRRKHKDEAAAAGGALSLTVFVLKAAVAALKAFPRFNSSIDPAAGEIILKRYYHIGVAVDSDRGLIVPTIRDVERKNITELAVELKTLADRTRQGKIERADLEGASFTITNIGPLGGTTFTPIVNYPQVAILGMAQARLQPTVVGDLEHYRIVPRLKLPLILGFDHRVVDGADAARFLSLVIQALESPEKLLMLV